MPVFTEHFAKWRGVLKVNKFFPYSVAVGLLSLVLAIPTQAQQTENNSDIVPLLSTECTKSGRGYYYPNSSKDVPIDEELFTSIFWLSLSQPTQLTCKIPQDIETLDLGFGVSDDADEEEQIKIDIYLDEVLITSDVMVSGEGENLLIDVSNVSNVTIDASCSKGSCFGSNGGNLYFWRAKFSYFSEDTFFLVSDPSLQNSQSEISLNEQNRVLKNERFGRVVNERERDREILEYLGEEAREAIEFYEIFRR